jgi:hypothetical protein
MHKNFLPPEETLCILRRNLDRIFNGASPFEPKPFVAGSFATSYRFVTHANAVDDTIHPVSPPPSFLVWIQRRLSGRRFFADGVSRALPPPEKHHERGNEHQEAKILAAVSFARHSTMSTRRKMSGCQTASKAR